MGRRGKPRLAVQSQDSRRPEVMSLVSCHWLRDLNRGNFNTLEWESSAMLIYQDYTDRTQCFPSGAAYDRPSNNTPYIDQYGLDH